MATSSEALVQPGGGSGLRLVIEALRTLGVHFSTSFPQ